MSSDRPSDFPSEHPSDFPERPRYGHRDLQIPRDATRLRLVRGDTFLYFGPPRFDNQVRRVWPGSPPGTPPTVFDLTGCSVVFAAKLHQDDPDNQAVFLLSTAGGQVTLTNPTNGNLKAVGLPVATYQFPGGTTRLFFALKVTDVTGVEFTADRGTIEVESSSVAAI